MNNHESISQPPARSPERKHRPDVKTIFTAVALFFSAPQLAKSAESATPQERAAHTVAEDMSQDHGPVWKISPEVQKAAEKLIEDAAEETPKIIFDVPDTIDTTSSSEPEAVYARMETPLGVFSLSAENSEPGTPDKGGITFLLNKPSFFGLSPGGRVSFEGSKTRLSFTFQDETDGSDGVGFPVFSQETGPIKLKVGLGDQGLVVMQKFEIGAISIDAMIYEGIPFPLPLIGGNAKDRGAKVLIKIKP